MSTAADGGHAALLQRWFPLCAVADLPPGHVLEAELLGRELAVWRGSDGVPNVWENRCPHRGMRLTLGANLGDALRCAYHGYRFGAGSARCLLVPAEPGRTPPASLRVARYPALEREDLIWTRLADPAAGGDASAPTITSPGRATATALYPVVVRAPAGEVARALAHYRFRAATTPAEPLTSAETCATTALDPFCVESVAARGVARSVVRLHLRPVDAGCTVIHGVLSGEPGEARPLAALRQHAARLNALRRELESGAQAVAGPAAVRPVPPVPPAAPAT